MPPRYLAVSLALALANAGAIHSPPPTATLAKTALATSTTDNQTSPQNPANLAPQEPDAGFLCDTGRDWLTIVNTVGVVITTLGFIGGVISICIARKQLIKTATANQAATEAALKQLNESRDRYRSHVIVQVNGLFQDAKRYVELEQWSNVVLRLGDLAGWIQQSSYNDAELNDLGDRLSTMATTFSRIQRSDLSFSDSLSRKWDALCKNLSVKIGQLSAPFPVPVPEENP